MSRFVRPDSVRVPLKTGGDWIEIKQRLNAGEQRARMARMALAGVDGALRVNHFEVGLSTITAYLLDWSLKDDDGKPVVIRDLSVEKMSAVLDGLDPDSFGEILSAIEAHETEQDAAREKEKNGQGGENKSSATSPSPA